MNLPPDPAPRRAFTLVELLVVMGLIVAMLALAVPAVISAAKTGALTRALYEVTGALENARTYAVANQTYVYVGFVQDDDPNGNRTRLVMATIASRDGTRPYVTKDASAKDLDMSTTGPIRQVGKIIRVDDVRFVKRADMVLSQLNAPQDAFVNRPRAEPAGQSNPTNGIVPDNDQITQYPFTLTAGLRSFANMNYTFARMVEFAPDGSCISNPAYDASSGVQRDVAPVNEIDLRPTRGRDFVKNDVDVFAVQYGGMTGQVKFYRPGAL